MKKKSLFVILSILILSLVFTGCGKDESGMAIEEKYQFPIITGEDDIEAEIILETGEKIELELYPKIAPVTVSNFKYLADKGFYDGLIFHRVIKGFMIQGGCPDGNGTGGPGYSIRGEFEANGIKNSIKHERGVISMARAQDYNSAGSQFFIMHEDAPHLDGQYAAFGKVTEGISVIDKIAEAETDANDKPLKDIKIKSIRITED